MSHTQMPSLFPENLPEREAITVPMSELPPDVLLLSPEVSQDLVDSIKEWGLQQPIVVSPVRKNGDRDVYAGNRRIKAARKLGWDEIDAYELTQDPNAAEIDPRVLAEQLNSTAKPNPIVQLESIEFLRQKGYDEKQISKALKLKLGTVRARLRLQTLHPKLREGVKRNKISFGNADRIAKMSETVQERLAKRFVEDGKLPWSVIDEERRRKTAAVTASFDIDDELDEIPNGADPTTEAIMKEMYESVRELKGSGFSTEELRALLDTPMPETIPDPPAPRVLPITGEEYLELKEKVDTVLGGKRPAWTKNEARIASKLLEAL